MRSKLYYSTGAAARFLRLGGGRPAPTMTTSRAAVAAPCSSWIEVGSTAAQGGAPPFAPPFLKAGNRVRMGKFATSSSISDRAMGAKAGAGHQVSRCSCKIYGFRRRGARPTIRLRPRCTTRTSVRRRKRTPKLSKERVPKYLGYFERLLADNGGAFVTGRRLTHVDLSLFQSWRDRYAFPNRSKAREHEIPGLVGLHDRVRRAEHQGVSEE